MGTKSIQVSETFHAYVKAHKREGETMGEALVRLTGGPEPEAVASLVSEETAEAMEEAITKRNQRKTTSRERVVEQFEKSDDS
ncbi:hypothetical protein [Halorubrum trueperi]|uniref:Antitoxin n=1 Tax=Halorubrum trueperi TaxID=2004704 RepID=A0ABD5UNY2_9EURY